MNNLVQELHNYGELSEEDPLPKHTLVVGLVPKILTEEESEKLAQKFYEWAEGYYLPMGGKTYKPSFKDQIYFEGC